MKIFDSIRGALAESHGRLGYFTVLLHIWSYMRYRLEAATGLIAKELLETYQRPSAPVGLLAVSIFVVWVSGKLVIDRPPLRIFLYIGGASEAVIDEARLILQEFDKVSITEMNGDIVRPAAMQRIGAHFAAVRRGGHWIVLHEFPTLLLEEESIAQLVAYSLNHHDLSAPGPLSLLSPDGGDYVSRMSSLPGELQLQLVPRTLALVVVFLPFVLVVRSYSREIAFGTLPILLATLRGGWGKIAAAKISVAIWLVMIAFLFLLPVIRLIFGFIPKPGLSSTVGVQILAMFISASFGLMAAIVARNETQVHIAMGVYFLFLVLLSGFLFPLETAAPIVQLASYGNPMTFSSKLLEYWLFYGTEPSMFWWDISCLLAQCAVVTALLGISITFARWRV